MAVGEQSPAATPVAEPDEGLGGLVAQRDAPVGGQAVLEGVMMRGIRTWAVAVRAPAQEGSPEDALGEIKVQTNGLTSVLAKHRLLRLPIVRGVVALGES